MTDAIPASEHDDSDEVDDHAGASDRSDENDDLRGPFLVYRDTTGKQHVVSLKSPGSMTIGRSSGCDIQLSGDAQVSRVHAQLERVGPDWTVIDDGLSRNGTYVNGERVSGRRRLQDGDTVLIGSTSVTYRAFRGPVSQATVVAGDLLAAVTSLSDTQRQVLAALCRPFRDGAPYATPATNQQIGAELYLSVDAVKTHLRTLFHKFHIEDLPQNQKRAKLVERAFALGIVSRRDL
jgi:hypothetical protein